ncbi:MAG TPA: hypothetical protein VK697_12625 [Methylomirabilota bacterium]|nr:hypothetical protein [Methylomirabilota bacterium]
MRNLLRVVRGLAVVEVVLSLVALPLGVVALRSAISTDVGDNGMGDTFALGTGLTLLVVGVAGIVLGSTLAILATRALPDPVEVDRSRRTVLAAALPVAGFEVLLSAVVGGGWLLNASAIAAFAVGFLVVAITSRRRGEPVLAGALAVALLALGVFPLLGQASQNDTGARRAERVALLPVEWQAAVAAATAAAPDRWAVPTLSARVTDYAPSEEGGFLPAGLVGQLLRGIIVVDCAGSERLEVVARDRDAPADVAPVVLGTTTCRPEPQVVTIAIPIFTVDSDPSATYVLGIAVDPVNEGPTGGMNRALLLVALTDTPDPDREALLAPFVAAFGTEEPR